MRRRYDHIDLRVPRQMQFEAGDDEVTAFQLTT
jgi:hypothetical protein